jgi:hypothetical protein
MPRIHAGYTVVKGRALGSGAQAVRYRELEIAPPDDGRLRCHCGAPTADVSCVAGIAARECRQCWAARWDRIWGRR